MNAQNRFYTVGEIRERLSISTLVFRGFRSIGEGSLAELASSGITRIEVLESPEQYDMTDAVSMAHVARACRSSGIQVGAYHCYKTNFADVDSEAKRKERVDLCRRQIDTMLELGGNLWASHAGAGDADQRSVAELARHVEATPAAIAVENFTREGVSVADRVSFLDEMDHPKVGMLLDIGHVRDDEGRNPMTLAGGPSRILEQCGHHLRHVHLHGFKNGRDHHPPLVEGGSIQWVELFRKLHAIGYAGYFNFEPLGEPHHADVLQATASAPQRIADMEAQTPAADPG